MASFTAISAALGVLGVIASVIGITRLDRDPRRLSAYAFSLAGIGTALLSLGLVLYIEADAPHLLVITTAIMSTALALGNIVGYPLLVGFLLWAGLTTIRREARSFANMMAFLFGVVLLFLPTTLVFLDPEAFVHGEFADQLKYGLFLGLLLIVSYIACCFGIFVVASVVYRFRRPHRHAAAIIVLGAGLINGEVPPLLAGRLHRSRQAQQQDAGHPVIITAGGQGDDEPRSEGSAMREYLLDLGVAPDRVVAEELSTSTEENLVNAQQLLSDKSAPVTVVTSNYHVFRTALLTRNLGLRARVIGAPTSWYYLPGAVVREFAAIMRDHLRIHVLAVAAVVVLTMAVIVDQF